MKYTSPIGRIVQGNPLVGNPQTIQNTNTPKLGKDNTQLVNWYANVAFDKANPKTMEMITAIFTEAARLYPALFPFGYQAAARTDTAPPIHAGGCIRSDFAFKLKDGDGYDTNGKPHALKEGWKGCWIVQISTYAGAMRVVNGLTANSPITEVGSGPNHIKTGDFAICCLDIKTNGWAGDGQSKPGIFMNPDLLQLVGYGDAIVSGPNPDEMLKDAAAAAGGYVPAGMSATPSAAPLPGALPQPLALPGTAGPLPTALGLPSITPPVALALPAVVAAPQYTLSPEAVAAGHTKEALNALGHTDESLVANGYLVAVAAPAPALSLPSLAAPAAAPALALPVIPNHAVVAAVLATPQYKVTDAVAAAGHTLESLKAQGHTEAALLTAGYIVAV